VSKARRALSHSVEQLFCDVESISLRSDCHSLDKYE
jgi:hypothetical protein